MEKINGYDSAIALTGEYERLKPGGYICKIIAAKEETSKKSGSRMLTLALDIDEGEHRGFFKKRWEELKNNPEPTESTNVNENKEK